MRRLSKTRKKLVLFLSWVGGVRERERGCVLFVGRDTVKSHRV